MVGMEDVAWPRITCSRLRLPPDRAMNDALNSLVHAIDVSDAFALVFGVFLGWVGSQNKNLARAALARAERSRVVAEGARLCAEDARRRAEVGREVNEVKREVNEERREENEEHREVQEEKREIADEERA